VLSNDVFLRLRTDGGFNSGFGDIWLDDVSLYSANADLASPVPLPGAAWLLLPALAGSGWFRRRL